VHSPYSYNFSKNDKECFLFIGALHKRKGLDDLLGAFAQYLKAAQAHKGPNVNKLIIIGEGPERSNIEKFITKNDLESFVELAGEVKDNKLKLNYFKKSVACFSPKQAGLSVLESFSYGVPFVTYEDAISGGEHLNIVSGQNGFLVKDRNQLVDVMCLLGKNLGESQRLGKNAFVFYDKSRKINNMADVFIDAINFAIR
jgi:glycosyltransferase involved in cell wall biosynthesis